MTLIENTFRKINGTTYTYYQQQKWVLYSGFLMLLVAFFLLIDFINNLIKHFDTFNFLFVFFAYTIFLLFSILCIMMGVIKKTVEINTADKTIKFLYRNGYLRKSDMTFPFKLIQISSVRLGVSDANPMGSFMIKAGIWKELENGESLDMAFFSKQVETAQERDELMKELYYFFFPERKDKENIHLLTNGDATYLLSDEERFEFELRMKEEKEKAPKENKDNKNNENGTGLNVDL
jgi:hypothetical protein